MPATPIPDSYWVIPGKLLAGEYPGALDPEEACVKLRRFLSAGVTYFLDLTEEGELDPYVTTLQEEATNLQIPVTHRRMPIPDYHTPTVEGMRAILAAIDGALSAGQVVYVHCWGGIGRTGTVVGCWLVEQGMSGKEALAQIQRLRQGTPDGWKRSPETEAQTSMVWGWGRN